MLRSRCAGCQARGIECGTSLQSFSRPTVDNQLIPVRLGATPNSRIRSRVLWLINILILKAGGHYTSRRRQPRPEEIYHESVADSWRFGAFGARGCYGSAEYGRERAALHGEQWFKSSDPGGNDCSCSAGTAGFHCAHAQRHFEWYNGACPAGTSRSAITLR